MIVTASLARGAVREAVRLSSAQFDAMWEKLARTDLQAPATHRRFGEWFRKHRASLFPLPGFTLASFFGCHGKGGEIAFLSTLVLAD